MGRGGRLPSFGKHSVLVLILLLAFALIALGPRAPWAGFNVDAHSAGLANPAALEPHEPIHITDDAGFNASNGVRNGTGTAADPYVISDWLIDAALYPNSSAMIWLENTDSHVLVQNCQVIHLEAVGQFEAFYVGKYPGENMTPIIGPPTIDLTSNVTFLDNDIDSRYGYGIQIAEGSSNILAKGNQVTVHPDNVSGRDWIYGINVARGTHNVTIESNVVNAASSLYTTIGIHLSDYYVSEQRRASGLVARNNTVIDAAGGIHVESSRFTLVQDNTVYRTNLNSLAYGWPRAITVRESALNASLIHNVIRVELTGIIIGAATGRWDTYGSVTSANNTTIRDNTISNVTSGIQIGNVSGTQVINTTLRTLDFRS
jgi:parallel beta-helix repeat protein